jgi:hypothetical protein
MADPRLILMTFPQHWDGAGTLRLNVLLIPAVDPIGVPLIGADPATPTFATGTPTFAVQIQPGVAALPSATGPGLFTLVPTVLPPPADPVTAFGILAAAVTAHGKTVTAAAAPEPPTPRIRKALPESYLAAGGGPPDGNLTTTEHDFGCAVRGDQPPPPPPPPTSLSWGEIISYALRQPLLATRLGLRYQLSVTLTPAQAAGLATGGYVFVALAAADPWGVAGAAAPGSIRAHAGRLPPLDATARPVFAATEFTVDAATPPRDLALVVADAYADGFAKLVHCSQPTNTDAAVGDGSLAPATDLGIELGWDDEQVVTWHNDQLDLLKARQGGTLASAAQTPLGVLGYRVDVADVTPILPDPTPPAPTWQSLAKVTAFLPAGLGTFTGELTVEPVATRPSSTTGGDAWLPRYFAHWRGGSLCEPDPTPEAMTSGIAPPPPIRAAADLTTLLSYGRTYAFRVRLADLSSGGPETTNEPIDAAPNSIGVQTFQRVVPPKAPAVVQDPGPASPAPTITRPASLIVQRPQIGYPEVLFTHLGVDAAAREAIRTKLVTDASALIAGVNDKTGGGRVAGLPDPDVDRVEIEVAVRHPLHDTGTGTFQTLYRTIRALAAPTGAPPLVQDPGTSVDIVYVDAPNIVGWAAHQPDTGPLLVPRGRDVRISVRAVLRDAEPNYFAPEATPTMAASIGVRAEPAAEPSLLGRADAHQPVTGYLFRRPPGVDAPALADQLAALLDVAASGDSLTSPPGHRFLFGASKAVRHILSADGETLTFASSSELLDRWIVAIVLDLERDWTWDGLTDTGFLILRGGLTDTETTAASVGAVAVPRVLGPAATTNPPPVERSRTRLIFLDAVDPHEPVPGSFPQSIEHRWFVQPQRTPAGSPPDPGAPGPTLGLSPPEPITGIEHADQPLDLRLPIAIAPEQVPAIASVGLAMSPYVAGSGYASTEQRQRSLWVELTAPIANDVGDALFARVLAHGADPLLYRAQPEVGPVFNPPLSLDPELVRIVIPGDTDDRAGIDAMTQLSGSPTSAVHFLLPLPPGVGSDNPELFGFWSYEFRVGHAGPSGDLRWWSTANGRFGHPLRVVGVQHPPPPLTCHAGRFQHKAAANPAALIQGLRQSTSLPFALHAVIASAVATTTDPPPPTTATLSAATAAASTAAASTMAATLSTAAGSTAAGATAAGSTAALSPAVGATIAGLSLVPAPPSLIIATAPYATAVLGGRPLVAPDEPPHTQLWFFVYGQVVQADASSMRNILLATAPGVFVQPRRGQLSDTIAALLEGQLSAEHLRDRIGVAVFTQAELSTLLKAVHLPGSTPLSILAVELLPGGTTTSVSDAGRSDVASARVGTSAIFPFGRRILRASPLTPVSPFC